MADNVERESKEGDEGGICRLRQSSLVFFVMVWDSRLSWRWQEGLGVG